MVRKPNGSTRWIIPHYFILFCSLYFYFYSKKTFTSNMTYQFIILKDKLQRSDPFIFNDYYDTNMPIPIPIAIETRGRGVKNPIDDSISTANQRMSRTQGILVMTIPTMIRKLSFPNNPKHRAKQCQTTKSNPYWNLSILTTFYVMVLALSSLKNS